MYSTRSQESRKDKRTQKFGLDFRREETAWKTLVKIEIGVILKKGVRAWNVVSAQLYFN